MQTGIGHMTAAVADRRILKDVADQLAKELEIACDTLGNLESSLFGPRPTAIGEANPPLNGSLQDTLIASLNRAERLKTLIADLLRGVDDRSGLKEMEPRQHYARG